ncbi:methylmalonyl Co-A mutase-associated GTPase MeaB, partial [Rhodococcus sp. NPDC059234]
MPPTSRPPLDLTALGDSVLAGRRGEIAKAITLVESTRTDHREQ